MNNNPHCHPEKPESGQEWARLVRCQSSRTLSQDEQESGQQIITLSGTDYTRLISIMEQHADLTHSPLDRHILRTLKHNQPIQEQSDRNRLAEALTSGACCIDSKATLSPYI